MKAEDIMSTMQLHNTTSSNALGDGRPEILKNKSEVKSWTMVALGWARVWALLLGSPLPRRDALAPGEDRMCDHGIPVPLFNHCCRKELAVSERGLAFVIILTVLAASEPARLLHRLITALQALTGR